MNHTEAIARFDTAMERLVRTLTEFNVSGERLYRVFTPVGQRAFMAEWPTAHTYKIANLSYSAESLVPFTVLSLFEEKSIGRLLFYGSTDISIWVIDAVMPAQRGFYTLQVINSQGNDSATIFLCPWESSPHIVAFRSESVLIYVTAFLHCRTQSIKQPKIFWVNNESKAVGNSANVAYIFGNNGTLRILDTFVDDAGGYKCRARTSGDQVEAVVWLRVLPAPRVRVKPRDRWVAMGGTFNLSCANKGWPRPQMIWFFKGVQIVPDTKFVVTYQGDLIVSEVDDEDIGIYECRACNSAEKASDFAKVHLATPPSIGVSQNKQMIVRGDLLMLDCRVISGVPTPKIQWFKDGHQLEADKFINIREGHLTIRRAEETDAGAHACKANNLAKFDTKPLLLKIGELLDRFQLAAPPRTNGFHPLFFTRPIFEAELRNFRDSFVPFEENREDIIQYANYMNGVSDGYAAQN